MSSRAFILKHAQLLDQGAAGKSCQAGSRGIDETTARADSDAGPEAWADPKFQRARGFAKRGSELVLCRLVEGVSRFDPHRSQVISIQCLQLTAGRADEPALYVGAIKLPEQTLNNRPRGCRHSKRSGMAITPLQGVCAARHNRQMCIVPPNRPARNQMTVVTAMALGSSPDARRSNNRPWCHR